MNNTFSPHNIYKWKWFDDEPKYTVAIYSKQKSKFVKFSKVNNHQFISHHFALAIDSANLAEVTMFISILYCQSSFSCLLNYNRIRSNIASIYTDVQYQYQALTMDMLWEKFQWILPLGLKPISFQSKTSVICSFTTVVFIDFCLKKLDVFSQHFG